MKDDTGERAEVIVGRDAQHERRDQLISLDVCLHFPSRVATVQSVLIVFYKFLRHSQTIGEITERMPLFSSYSLRKLLHPYYITNMLLSTIYLLLRLVDPPCSSLFKSCTLEHRESEILFFTGVIIIFRTRKQGSLSLLPYASTACMFGKIGSVILFFYSDPIYGVVYTATCLVHLLVLPEPSYSGPESIVYFRGEELEEELKASSTGSKPSVWLIEFYAAWSTSCINFASIFSELSAKYALDNLKFGKVDVSRSPQTAERYKINTSFLSKQLPTLVLFKEGKEITRRPVVGDKGKLIPFNFNYEGVVSSFDLNNLHEECKKKVKTSTSDGNKKSN